MPQGQHSRRHIVANTSWEGRSIGIDDTTGREGVVLLLGEVELPACIVWEDCETLQLGVRACQLSVERGINHVFAALAMADRTAAAASILVMGCMVKCCSDREEAL